MELEIFEKALCYPVLFLVDLGSKAWFMKITTVNWLQDNCSDVDHCGGVRIMQV